MGIYFTPEGLAALFVMAFLAFALGLIFRFVMNPKVDTALEWLGFVVGLLVILWLGAGFLVSILVPVAAVAQEIMAIGFAGGIIAYRLVFSFFAK